MAWTVPTSDDEFWNLSENWVTALTEIRTALRDREDIQGRSHGALTLPSSGAEIRTVTRAFIYAARADIENMLEEPADDDRKFRWTNSSWTPTEVPSWGSLTVLRSGAASKALITQLQDVLDDMKYYKVWYFQNDANYSYPSGSSRRIGGSGEDYLTNASAEIGWDLAKAGDDGEDTDPSNDGDATMLWWAIGNNSDTAYGVFFSTPNQGYVKGPELQVDFDTASLDGVLVDAKVRVIRDFTALASTIDFDFTASAGATVVDSSDTGANPGTITYNSGNDPEFIGTNLAITMEIATAEPADHPFNAFPTPSLKAYLVWEWYEATHYPGDTGDVSALMTVRANATSVLTN